MQLPSSPNRVKGFKRLSGVDRKKKCDLQKPACHTCTRLGMQCEGYKRRILWEDDAVRQAIGRRGPSKSQKRPGPTENVDVVASSEDSGANFPVFTTATPFESEFHRTEEMGSECSNDTVPPTKHDAFLRAIEKPGLISIHDLSSPIELHLWDYYINRFARTYPTCRDDDNPFLTCLIPVALKFRPVKCAMLAIAGSQNKQSRTPHLRRAISRFTKEAITECLHISRRAGGHLLSSSDFPLATETAEADFGFPADMLLLASMDKICLVTTALLLVLLAKLSGDSCSSLRTHLQFAEAYFSFEDNYGYDHQGHLYVFLRSLFNYNQLLALIANPTPDATPYHSNQASQIGIGTPHIQQNYSTLLHRISSAVQDVSLSELDSWHGDLDFIPSLSTSDKTDTTALHPGALAHNPPPPSSSPCMYDGISNSAGQLALLRELYRTVGQVYFFQQLRDRQGLPNTLTTYAFPPFIAHENIEKLVTLAVNILQRFPKASSYNSALLMPLGIIASELRSNHTQGVVLERLDLLQNEFHFEHFGMIRQDFLEEWASAQSTRNDMLPARQLRKVVRLIG